MIDVAIIGAGPYGLSIAAHLKARGVDFRIFGSPMKTWLKHMPEGMHLKSEGFASSLFDPDSSFTLAEYSKQKGIPFAAMGLPVPLETFSSYGLEFQRKFVPNLEDKQVEALERTPAGFRIRVGDEEVVARRVVSAVGLAYYDHVPQCLGALPGELATHSSRQRSLGHFKGQDVAVVGAGASALDLAALLRRAGASVQVVARRSVIRFNDRGQVPRPLAQRIRNPMTGLGPGWKSVFCVKTPLMFRKLPLEYRLKFVKAHLGPAPCWFTKEDVEGKVPFHLGVTITKTGIHNGGVSLELTDRAGAHRTLTTGHVIAATGYKVDLRRLTFLSAEILAGIRSIEQTPALSSNFESSVPGLYFVGATAANAFGPLLRFAYGAGFTAKRISKHLAR